MKNISDLKEGDYIAFGFNYNGGEPNDIIVSNITSKHENCFLVHFSYGHQSLSEFVKPENIFAIGNNENGISKIKGWTGKFDIIKESSLFNN